MAEAPTGAWQFVERGEGGYRCRLCDWEPEPSCKKDTAYRHDLKHRRENQMVVRECKRGRTGEELRAMGAARQRRCYANKKMRYESKDCRRWGCHLYDSMLTENSDSMLSLTVQGEAARGQDLPVTVDEVNSRIF